MHIYLTTPTLERSREMEDLSDIFDPILDGAGNVIGWGPKGAPGCSCIGYILLFLLWILCAIAEVMDRYPFCTVVFLVIIVVVIVKLTNRKRAKQATSDKTSEETSDE